MCWQSRKSDEDEVTYDSNGNVMTITCDKALPDECITFFDIDGACPSEVRDAMWRLKLRSE